MERVTAMTAWLIRLLLIVTIAAAVIPMNPQMPASGLDASWVYALGEASAMKLVFGTDLVFTFGPYASIYTTAYHPATYHIVLLGSTFLALGFAILLGYLLVGRSMLLSLLVIFFLACSIGARDATLLLYPLLLSVFVYRTTLPRGDCGGIAINDGLLKHLIVATLFGVLGLIPLVKGSLLILAIAIGGLCALRFYFTGHRRLAVVALLAGIVSLLLFWLLAGQPLNGLPLYFINMFPIASGYTEAMSAQGPAAQITVYVVTCLVLTVTIAASSSVSWRNRLYVLATFGLFLFLAFKEGFVRHDGHAATAGDALFLAGVSFCMALTGRTRWLTLAICLAAWFSICNAYHPITLSTQYAQARNSYGRWGRGLWEAVRGTSHLNADFEEARARVRQQQSIPTMTGTSDIYPSDLSDLLASDNKWSPRPVFQSYSAYTPKLAEMNRLHLIGSASPDHIVFSLQPIDGRLPALEDGPSWPALMGLYRPVGYQGRYLYLDKRDDTARVPDVRSLLKQDHGMREIVGIPDSSHPIVAWIHMKRTFLGRIKGIFFKPEELRLTLNLRDGSNREYRFVPGMGEAGFTLSPFVEDTTDFLLSYGSRSWLENKKVVSIKIATKSKHPLAWAGYRLTLGELSEQTPLDISSLVPLARPTRILNEPQPLKEADCLGTMDYINGSPPANPTISYSSIVSIQGWIAENQRDPGNGSFAATLTTEAGATYIAPVVRYNREDVAAYFKSDVLDNSGYRAFIDTEGLGSNISLGIARKMDDAWVACSHFHRPVSLRAAP